MLFGHNSNVNVGKDVVHVQTEDRGTGNPVIDTTVHWKGRVLHRRTHKYSDLLPLDAEKEAALKVRIDEQHRNVMEEIRSGALKLALPAPVSTPPAIAAPAALGTLKVELVNAKTWLTGRNATLQLVVRDARGNAVSGAQTRARVDGAESPTEFAAVASVDGQATLQFEMPKLSGAEVALVIEAAHNGAKGHLRFQLRAKPRV
jgi:hypothetical protein